MTEAAAAPEPAPTGPEADVGSADPASTLRVAALLTLKRRKPADGPLQHPTPDDSSAQLDYGQDDNKQPATDVQMRTEGQHREEGEISDSEDPALKALATIKAESPPGGARVAPLLPVGEVYLDADHVRPGLSMNQEQYDTAKDIVLDLLGWGVPPHYLVDCNLSREIVYYVFSELNLRLPHNLDVTGLVQYTPAVVAKHSRPLSAMSSSSLVAKPAAALADSPTLHDIERQRRQELLARKAVQASRKIGKPSSDASPDASLSESYAPDQDVEMPPVIATEAVDDFLKSIGEKQSRLPEVDVKAQPVDDTMDVDDPPAQAFTVNGEGLTTDEPRPTGSPARSNAASLAGDINHTVDEHTPPQRTSRRGAKRPTAADFVDFDMGSRNGHPGPVPPLKRKSASFASVSGQRKLVIDLSDSEGGDDYPMQDAASVATPPSGAGNLVERKEEEIRKMRELIAQREKSRLQKAKSTRATPVESAREEASIIDSNANDSEPRSATVTPPLLESEGSVSGNGVQDSTSLEDPTSNAEDKQEPAAVDVESASSSSAQVRPANPIADDDPKPPKTRRNNSSLSSSSSIPASIPSLSSASPPSTAVPLPSLKPLKLAAASRRWDPTKTICKFESAGGVCRDADCPDLHLGQSASVELTDAEIAQYLSQHYNVTAAHLEAALGGVTRDGGELEARAEKALSLLRGKEGRGKGNLSLRKGARLRYPPLSAPTRSPPPLPPTMRKRQRTHDELPAEPVDDGNNFIADDVESGDDDDEDKPKGGQKQGRRKIKIEFIQDKSRRHITFSKRKAGAWSLPNARVSADMPCPGIMKKAYELSTLTGTQVLLLVVSETGLVYTFTTAKLQPLVTQPEGKNLIQACLNAPHGTLPSTQPVGQNIGRNSGPMGGPGGPPVASNMPGGLSISGGATGANSKDDDDANDDDEPAPAPAPASTGRTATSPHTTAPPPLSIPNASPTSPQQAHAPSATSPAQYSAGGSYHHQQHDGQMQYPSYSPGSYSYPQGTAAPSQPGAAGQQLGGLAAAAAQQHALPYATNTRRPHMPTP
uniref:MADS-box domain-containing protein n=1 Tax=Mycena chlorophos TaxID=658473 RepID=A0ABQ0MAF3_MYCCL|nr:predicted protein [Mycena chlorophos]